MKKTLIIHNDRIEILQDGYNIIERTIHGENIPEILVQALEYASDGLDMDNMNAVNVLEQLREEIERG